MVIDYGFETISLFAGAMLGAGVVAGLIAGLLGVGGGIVLVPILYYIFTKLQIDPSIRMHLAVGTSLSTIVFTSMSSSRAHYRDGSIDKDLLKSWAPWLLLGAIGGITVFGSMKSASLSMIFGVVSLLVAIYMLLAKEPAEETTSRFPKGPVRWGTGLGVGCVSSIMGIGGGTLSVPLLSAFKYPMQRAVGTAAAIGLLISIPGTAGAILSGLNAPHLPPFSVGYVNILAAVIVVPVTGFMAPYGARLAHTLSPQHLRYAFAVFLMLSAANMFLSVAS